MVFDFEGIVTRSPHQKRIITFLLLFSSVLALFILRSRCPKELSIDWWLGALVNVGMKNSLLMEATVKFSQCDLFRGHIG